MTDAAKLTALLAGQEPPVCAALTPFVVEAADFASGRVRLQFAEQPASSGPEGNSCSQRPSFGARTASSPYTPRARLLSHLSRVRNEQQARADQLINGHD